MPAQSANLSYVSHCHQSPNSSFGKGVVPPRPSKNRKTNNTQRGSRYLNFFKVVLTSSGIVNKNRKYGARKNCRKYELLVNKFALEAWNIVACGTALRVNSQKGNTGIITNGMLITAKKPRRFN